MPRVIVNGPVARDCEGINRGRRDIYNAIVLRDGGCRYPGCPRPAAYCEAHHAVFWRHGGATAADNLVLLCRYHHHLVHDRHHELKLQPDGTVKVTKPDGRVLTSRPRGPTAVPV